jgi:proteasome lid subunit RPN8/RPN11
MLAHAVTEAPNECVGLLGGTPEGRVTERFPLVNALANPRRFESEPRSLLAAERRRRDLGLEFLAVYHSHPTSPAVPSRTDTDPEVNFWLGTDIVSIIISLAGEEPEARAYWLEPGRYAEAEMMVV